LFELEKMLGKTHSKSASTLGKTQHVWVKYLPINYGAKTLNRQTEDLSIKAHLGPPKDGKFHFHAIYNSKLCIFIFNLIKETSFCHHAFICLYFYFYFFEWVIFHYSPTSWHLANGNTNNLHKIVLKFATFNLLSTPKKSILYKNFVYYKSTSKWIC